MPNSIDFYNGIILHVIPVRIIVPCYMWKNIRKQYKNNKLKLIVSTWDDEFQLPGRSYSVSDIQDYIEYIMKKHETLTSVPSIYVNIKRINNRLVLKQKIHIS